MNIGLISYVYGDYQYFIPLYLHRLNQNKNRDFKVKIFLKEELDEETRELVEEVDHPNYEIVENYYVECPLRKLGAIRYLLPKEDVAEFEYIHLGDIDSLYRGDLHNIFKSDLKFCKDNNLPLCGMAYKTRFPKAGLLNRFWLMSAFIHVDPYYEKMWPVIEEVQKGRFKEVVDYFNNWYSDEIFYYHLLNQVFDMGVFWSHSKWVPAFNVHCGVDMSKKLYVPNISDLRFTSFVGKKSPALGKLFYKYTNLML